MKPKKPKPQKAWAVVIGNRLLNENGCFHVHSSKKIAISFANISEIVIPVLISPIKKN